MSAPVDSSIMWVCATRSLSYAIVLAIVQYSWKSISVAFIHGFEHKVPPKERKIWYNRATATMHAVIQFSLAANYWLFENPNRTISPRVSPFEAMALDLMLGYLIFDTVVEATANCERDTMLHHVMGLISHFLTRYYDCGAAAYYTMIVFLAEASTPFLHTSWLLHVMKQTHTSAFVIAVVCLLFSFFVSRVLLSPYILYHMIVYKGEEWKGQTGNYYLNVTLVAAFVALNYFWFYKLVSIVNKVK